jgi:hypothetical protein
MVRRTSIDLIFRIGLSGSNLLKALLETSTISLRTGEKFDCYDKNVANK